MSQEIEGLGWGESTPGETTRFQLTLPVAAGAVQQAVQTGSRASRCSAR